MEGSHLGRDLLAPHIALELDIVVLLKEHRLLSKVAHFLQPRSPLLPLLEQHPSMLLDPHHQLDRVRLQG